MKISHKTIESYRVAIAGLLFIFGARILIDLVSTVYIGFAVAAIALGIVLSRITLKHFDHGHHHSGDSAIDAIPILVVFFANIAHPAIDGFSMVETWRFGGMFAGVLYGMSIMLHEILRQSAFITALKPLHIHWRWVVGTALIGILFGVGTAISGTRFFGRYEIVADIATLFSYSFVISEFYFDIGTKGHKIKNTLVLCILGASLGVLIVFLIQ